MNKTIFFVISAIGILAHGQDLNVSRVRLLRLCPASDVSIVSSGVEGESYDRSCKVYGNIVEPNTTPIAQPISELSKNSDWDKCHNRMINAAALLADKQIQKSGSALDWNPEIEVYEDLKIQNVRYDLQPGETHSLIKQNLKSMNNSIDKSGLRIFNNFQNVSNAVTYRLLRKGTCHVTVNFGIATKSDDEYSDQMMRIMLGDSQLDNPESAKREIVRSLKNALETAIIRERDEVDTLLSRSKSSKLQSRSFEKSTSRNEVHYSAIRITRAVSHKS
jgi:hypothetical protein